MNHGEHGLTGRTPTLYLVPLYEPATFGGYYHQSVGRGSEEPTAYYRSYLMAFRSFRIEHFHDFVAEDDPAAIAIAMSIEAFGTRELWSDARLVKRWEQLAPAEIDQIYSSEPDGTGHSTWRDADSSEPSGSSVTMGAK